MNIADPFLFYAKLSPGALAIGVPGAKRAMVSYGLLARMVNNVGKTALAWGLARGQVVAIHVTDKIFHAALILGLARIGIVTISARNTQLPKELGVHAVITDTTLPFANVGRVMIAEAEAWTMSGDGEPLADRALYRAGGDDPCRITLTSGSTGVPRGIAFSHRMAFERNARLGLTRDLSFQVCSRFYCDLGFATDPGFRDLLRMLWKGGAIFYYGDDAEGLVQALDLYKVEGMIASPEGLAEYLKFYEAYPQVRCSLNHILTSGASLPRSLSVRVRARMAANLSCTYGATETGGIAIGPAQAIENVPGAAGFVTPGAEVEIVNEAGRALPMGQEGIVRMRTPQTVRGYVGDPPESQRAFRDGWFHPGDLGRLRDDGMLIILGRETAVLNLSGDKLRPELVEDMLTALPAIEQAAAFVETDELGVSKLSVALVLRANARLDEEAIRAFCRDRLGAAFVPARVLVVEALPRNAAGKLDRSLLPGLVPLNALKKNMNGR